MNDGESEREESCWYFVCLTIYYKSVCTGKGSDFNKLCQRKKNDDDMIQLLFVGCWIDMQQIKSRENFWVEMEKRQCSM